MSRLTKDTSKFAKSGEDGVVEQSCYSDCAALRKARNRILSASTAHNINMFSIPLSSTIADDYMHTRWL